MTINAIAVGDESALKGLKISNALCGQVLRVNCGSEDVEAIMASTCNIHSGTCGIDMISKTWNTATTDNAAPGIVECSVSLTDDTRAFGDGTLPQCFIRPDSRAGNYSEWYTSAGLMNTAGKLVQSATLDGVVGTHNGASGYFDFHGSGFGPESTIVFTYDDESIESFPFAQCKSADVFIWRS